MNDIFFSKTLPEKTAKLIDSLENSPPEFINNFYLSGGTALSIQIGHRESEDLDFFSQTKFNPDDIEKQLFVYGKLHDVQKDSDTLNTFLNGVKLQFLEYPYEVIAPFRMWRGIKLSSILDIACTKLITISSRGNKKDFIDLYFLLDNFPLPKLLENLKKKYKNINYNQTHILKSLVYFEDADNQPAPRMHKSVSWDEVKDKIITVTRKIKFE